jgi:hypothetical protein
MGLSTFLRLVYVGIMAASFCGKALASQELRYECRVVDDRAGYEGHFYAGTEHDVRPFFFLGLGDVVDREFGDVFVTCGKNSSENFQCSIIYERDSTPVSVVAQKAVAYGEEHLKISYRFQGVTFSVQCNRTP